MTYAVSVKKSLLGWGHQKIPVPSFIFSEDFSRFQTFRVSNDVFDNFNYLGLQLEKRRDSRLGTR